MDDGNAAARPPRSALHPVPLGRVTRVPVGRRCRKGIGIADGEARDVVGRPEVGVYERRRQHLGIGDIVEVGTLGVERQVRARVDVEIQKVADRASVLGPVEPLERAETRIGIPCRGLVDERLQGFHQSQKRVGARPRRPWKGHHAGPELHDHLLGRLGQLGSTGDLEVGERQVAGEHHVVVADHAVLPDDRRQGVRRQASGASAPRGAGVGAGSRKPGARAPNRRIGDRREVPHDGRSRGHRPGGGVSRVRGDILGRCSPRSDHHGQEDARESGARRPEPVDGSFREPCATETGAGRTGTRRCAFRLRAQGPQHDTQLWLLTAPRPSRSSIVAGNGWMRWTGPFAMSTVVCPRRLTAMTSAP